MSTEDRMLAIINRLSDAANTADGSAARFRSVVLHPEECKLLLEYIAAGQPVEPKITPQRTPLLDYMTGGDAMAAQTYAHKTVSIGSLYMSQQNAKLQQQIIADLLAIIEHMVKANATKP